MWIYLLIFAIPLFFYIYWNGRFDKSDVFLKYYMFGLAVFVGLGDMLGGYDRYIYSEIFDSVADDLYAGVDMSSSFAFAYYEPGYMIFNWLIALVTGNRYIFIFLITLLTYTNFYIAFKRHVDNYPLAFLLFLGLMFFFSFTYLRQILGCSFAMLTIKYLEERKLLKFTIAVIFVSLVHKSGIIFAAMYFIPQRKFKIQTILLVFSICFALGVFGIASSFYDLYVETTGIDDRFEYTRIDDIRIAYLAEVVVFSSIILSNYKYLGNEKGNVVFLNMALVFCCILLAFIRSENGGRMSWYFLAGIIVTFANLLNKVPVFKKRMLQTTLIVLSAGLFIRIIISWGSLITPYKSFLTSGYRENDRIRIGFEYEHKYDDDKFYRLVPFNKY